VSKGDRSQVDEDLNRAYIFMLVGMLSIGLLAGACGAACLIALLVDKW
jgi:hypothetical protein